MVPTIMGDESSTMDKQPLFSLTELLQRDRIETKLNLPVSSSTISAPLAPSHYFLEKKFNQFIDEVVLEQLQNADRLGSLNPSRRESLGKFLAELSKQPEPENAQETLKTFIAQDRTP